jgi:hypothetical protein
MPPEQDQAKQKVKTATLSALQPKQHLSNARLLLIIIQA